MWNEEFFGGELIPALVQLTDPGQNHCYGCCTTYSGLAGIHTAIKIRQSILDGTLRDLVHGTRDPEGLRRFLEDVLLHEMVHQYHFEVTGETDRSYSGHGPAFSKMANEIGQKLRLARVGRTCKKRDHEAKGLQSPSQWPHDVRDPEYYKGAHAPNKASRDLDAELREKIDALVRKHGVEKVQEAVAAPASAELVAEIQEA